MSEADGRTATGGAATDPGAPTESTPAADAAAAASAAAASAAAAERRSGADRRAAARRFDPSALRLLWISFVIIALDQITKILIVMRFELFERIDVFPILEITRLHNKGAAFSFLHDAGGWQHWFFLVLAGIVSAGIVFWLSRLRSRANAVLASGLALILGGALGNAIDRVWHGHVVDFIHFHWRQQWYFPAFNVADTAITIGAALLILDSLLESRRVSHAHDTGADGAGGADGAAASGAASGGAAAGGAAADASVSGGNAGSSDR